MFTPSLDSFAHNLQIVWPISVKDLIGTYTLAPLYLPFLSQAQAKKVLYSMASAVGGNIHTRSGIVASPIKSSSFFRYCPECIKEQELECGELYWRRSHQLPGLIFCKHHSCFLEDSPIHYHSKQKHHFIAPRSTYLDATVKYLELSDLEKNLYDRYLELLQTAHISGFGENRWTLFYRNIAKELGFMHKSRVQHQDIYHYVKSKWMGSTFEYHFRGAANKHWLVSLFRKHRRSFHPLRHLLVISALTPEGTIPEVFSKVSKLPATVTKTVSTKQKVKATESDIEKHRDCWRDLVKRNPDVGVKGLRGMPDGGFLYAWLYRNDKQWLMRNRPKHQRVKGAHYTVDYQKWDESNLVLLESAYNEFLLEKNRLRLTQARFIKSLPRANSVEKHLAELPITRHWLATHAESAEDHRLYRLRTAYEEIKTSHLEVKRWRLLRFANIRKELITPKIEAELLKLGLRRD